MFEYTRVVLGMVWDDVKRTISVIRMIVGALPLFYLAYAIIRGTGIIYVNASLLAVSIFYFIFNIVTNKSRKKENKAVRHAVKTTRLLIKAIPLFVTVYGICIAANSLDMVTMFLSLLGVVGWVLSVMLEVVTYYIELRSEQLSVAIGADFEPYKRIINAPSRLINKIMGNESPEEEEPSETRILLDAKVEEKNSRKAEEKARKREEKKNRKSE